MTRPLFPLYAFWTPADCCYSAMALHSEVQRKNVIHWINCYFLQSRCDVPDPILNSVMSTTRPLPHT